MIPEIVYPILLFWGVVIAAYCIIHVLNLFYIDFWKKLKEYKKELNSPSPNDKKE